MFIIYFSEIYSHINIFVYKNIIFSKKILLKIKINKIVNMYNIMIYFIYLDIEDL